MDLISLALRLEIGIPFAIFSWPLSLFTGIAFSIANELAVKYYKLKSKIFEKALILVIFSLVNTIIIAIGVLFHGTYVQHKGTENEFIDYENIKAAILFVPLFLLTMVLWRMLFLGIPYSLSWVGWTKDRKRN
ncbi:MAG: hypothetical protein OEW48_11295 [Phycisphaerae bacterium]|nr:hypothetical protein [Phycisphaerae bacterium]